MIMEERLRFKLRGAEETDVIANPPGACATATGAAAFYRVTRPPSMRRVWPVIMAASSETRKATGPAMSPGSTLRLTACASRTSVKCSSGLPSSAPGLLVRPGAMAFTVMPLAPSSTASARVKPTTAPLLAM